jgi:hypothetical protein
MKRYLNIKTYRRVILLLFYTNVNLGLPNWGSESKEILTEVFKPKRKETKIKENTC